MDNIFTESVGYAIILAPTPTTSFTPITAPDGLSVNAGAVGSSISVVMPKNCPWANIPEG